MSMFSSDAAPFQLKARTHTFFFSKTNAWPTNPSHIDLVRAQLGPWQLPPCHAVTSVTRFASRAEYPALPRRLPIHFAHACHTCPCR